MQSKASTVDDYLTELPAARRERLKVVRELCRECLPDHEERMQYGMPVYVRDGKTDFAWASQARHIALYVMKTDAVAANAERLAGHHMGKSCLKLNPSADIDAELVRALLEATAASRAAPC